MLTLHHLNDSRSQRILWLLEELGVPYEMRRYQGNPETRLAPPELKAVHPLGKSPVITDGDIRIAESGAIVDYVIRRHGLGNGQPAMMPAPGANHLGYVDGALKGREYFVGNSLTGADIQMSFVGDMAKAFNKLGPYPNLSAWLSRMHARPAFSAQSRRAGRTGLRSRSGRRPGQVSAANASRDPYAVSLGTGTLSDGLFRQLPLGVMGPGSRPGRRGKGLGDSLSPPYLA